MFFLKLTFLLVLTGKVYSHVALSFPPARKYNLDFLDTIRYSIEIDNLKLGLKAFYSISNNSSLKKTLLTLLKLFCNQCGNECRSKSKSR